MIPLQQSDSSRRHISDALQRALEGCAEAHRMFLRTNRREAFPFAGTGYTASRVIENG